MVSQDENMRIAVVEDDLSVLDAAGLVLEAHGWQVDGYATAEGFLAAWLAGAVVQCVLLDPHLPGHSGVDVAKAVADSRIPVVVLTARPESPLIRELRDLGARAFITKPVQATMLIETIEATLAGT